nr:mechanosensitive ion channel family protein [uncultured Cetobacterium sp.]
MTTESSTFLQHVWENMTNEKFLVDFTVEVLLFFVRVGLALVFFIVAKKFLKKFLVKYYESSYFKSIDSSFRTFLSSIIDTGIIIFLIIVSLLIIGFQQTSLVAFLGTVGIGVGLSLKDNLSNFVGGLIILIFKTYSVGDEVQVNNAYGNIYSIDVFSTTIIGFNNELITIPNGNIITSQVINYSKIPTRRIKIIVSVDYSTDLDLAQKLLLDMVHENPNILSYPKPYTNIDAYADSSINIAVKAWTKVDVYWGVYYDLMSKVKPTLDKENISIPFPQMDIKLKKDL